MEHTWNFILFILDRALSGIVNGLFYAGSAWVWPALVALLLLTVFITLRNLRTNWSSMPKWKRVLAVMGVVCSAASVVFLGLSFKAPSLPYSDIHLWTFMGQTAISATLFISTRRFWKHLRTLVLAVSPSAFFQKLFVNVFGGYGWNYVGTDEADGKHWGMKIFGRQVNVPRVSDWRVRLALSAICIGAFIFISVRNHHNKPKPIKQALTEVRA